VPAALLLAASVIPAPPPPTAEQAIERQRSVVREVVRFPCGRAATPEEIVVCGQDNSGVPTRRANRDGFDPEWVPPAEGPWFSWNRGPHSITSCAVRGDQGTGAGLGLRLRF
jgi:hypothetical protein